MSIKPIDLQTNIGQLPEVSKAEHARQGLSRTAAPLINRQLKNQTVNSRLEQAEKVKNLTMDERKRSGGGSEQHGKGKEERTFSKRKDEG